MLCYPATACSLSRIHFGKLQQCFAGERCQSWIHMYMVCYLRALPTHTPTDRVILRPSNTVVYNLWSACLDIRNETVPIFNNWTSSCQTNMINITTNGYPLHEDAKGVDIPTWAYISLRADSTFDLAAALEKTEPKGWSTFQIVLPIVVGVSLLAIAGALFLWYRRRTRRKYGISDTTGGSWRSTFRSARHQLTLKSSTKRVRSTASDKPWVIDDFESATQRTSLESEDGQDGHVWSAPSPTSLHVQIPRRVQQYAQRWLRNPFKKRPVQVVSLPPQQGFRVDDIDPSAQAFDSRRPALNSDSGQGNVTGNNDRDGWSRVRTEEIFDSQDDGLDERSVLLISRAPGVDFSLESCSVRAPTTTADINVIPLSAEHNSYEPPSSPGPPTPASPPALLSPTSPISPRQILPSNNPHSFSHSRNHSVESLVRPSRTDPIMLFPPSVRGAGYSGITNIYPPHSRNISSDSQLANAIPMKPLSMS